MCVQAGLVLSKLQMVSVLDAKSMVSLLVATASLLLTALLVRHISNKNDMQVFSHLVSVIWHPYSYSKLSHARIYFHDNGELCSLVHV